MQKTIALGFVLVSLLSGCATTGQTPIEFHTSNHLTFELGSGRFNTIDVQPFETQLWLGSAMVGSLMTKDLMKRKDPPARSFSWIWVTAPTASQSLSMDTPLHLSPPQNIQLRGLPSVLRMTFSKKFCLHCLLAKHANDLPCLCLFRR